MRKSLGSKRREIPEDAREKIVRIYAEMLDGDGEHGEFSKIFDTSDFGYREIRVERPLRLNFQATPERTARLAEEKALAKLDASERDELLDAIASHLPSELFRNRDGLVGWLEEVWPDIVRPLLATNDSRGGGSDFSEGCQAKRPAASMAEQIPSTSRYAARFLTKQEIQDKTAEKDRHRCVESSR